MRRPDSIRHVVLAALALLAPLAWHAPLGAEEPVAAATVDDPYEEFHAAMDEFYGTDQEFNRQYGLMMQELRQLPLYQRLERSEPGIVNAIGAAMRPWIKLQTERYERRTKPHVIELMKVELTPADARKLAAYSRTERGRKFLRAYSDAQVAAPQADRPRQPLGQPTAFLKPAEGYAPPRRVTPAAAPKPAPKPAAPAAPDPAVAAVLDDPALQARASRFFTALSALYVEMDGMDKDIQEGMFRDIDYAASTYGYRLFERPL